jgi:type IV pilus assembly protein PilA
LSLSEIRKSAGRIKGDGVAIAGLVLGYVGVGAIPGILIIAAIAIPNLLRARMAANEASAVSGIRILNAAELGYSVSHPKDGFTCSLSTLADAGLFSGPLAKGQKDGYAFELNGCTPEDGDAANRHYQVVAYPLREHQTGIRAFCSNESMVVKVDPEGSTQKCLESGEPLR